MQFEHDTSSRKAPEPGNQASRSSFLEAALFNSPESQNFLILLLESVEKNTLKTKLKSNCNYKSTIIQSEPLLTDLWLDAILKTCTT